MHYPCDSMPCRKDLESYRHPANLRSSLYQPSSMADSMSRITIGEAQRSVEARPTKPIAPPQPSGSYTVNDQVKASFPVPGTKVIRAQHYGESLWGKTAKIRVELPSGERDTYFLKVVTLGETGRHMCEGEFESLREIYVVSPNFVPRPYAWGKYVQQDADPEVCFLLTEFRDVGEQVSWCPLNRAGILCIG